MNKLFSKLIATLSVVALIFICGTSFANNLTPPTKNVVGKYVFKRTPPTVGSYVRVWGSPGLPCYEWSSTGDNPGNALWWVNKKMQVVAVYYSCDGVQNGAMTIKAILPGSPYNNYQTSWPSDMYSPW
jgi:hypothetical protein